jgi:hypothetical protein
LRRQSGHAAPCPSAWNKPSLASAGSAFEMTIIGTRMIREDKTARQIFEEVMANPARSKFGFGEKVAIVNIDFQNA